MLLWHHPVKAMQRPWEVFQSHSHFQSQREFSWFQHVLLSQPHTLGRGWELLVLLVLLTKAWSWTGVAVFGEGVDVVKAHMWKPDWLWGQEQELSWKISLCSACCCTSWERKRKGFLLCRWFSKMSEVFSLRSPSVLPKSWRVEEKRASTWNKQECQAMSCLVSTTQTTGPRLEFPHLGHQLVVFWVLDVTFVCSTSG